MGWMDSFTMTDADLVIIGINMIMALSMFLPLQVGQLSFGQAGFMSIGAHLAVVLTLYAGVWFPLALLLAGAPATPNGNDGALVMAARQPAGFWRPRCRLPPRQSERLGRRRLS